MPNSLVNSPLSRQVTNMCYIVRGAGKPFVGGKFGEKRSVGGHRGGTKVAEETVVVDKFFLVDWD